MTLDAERVGERQRDAATGVVRVLRSLAKRGLGSVLVEEVALEIRDLGRAR